MRRCRVTHVHGLPLLFFFLSSLAYRSVPFNFRQCSNPFHSIACQCHSIYYKMMQKTIVLCSLAKYADVERKLGCWIQNGKRKRKQCLMPSKRKRMKKVKCLSFVLSKRKQFPFNQFLFLSGAKVSFFACEATRTQENTKSNINAKTCKETELNIRKLFTDLFSKQAHVVFGFYAVCVSHCG